MAPFFAGFDVLTPLFNRARKSGGAWLGQDSLPFNRPTFA
jgi:hypothetical protein